MCDSRPFGRRPSMFVGRWPPVATVHDAVLHRSPAVVVVIDRRPHVITPADMLIILVAVGHLGERPDPMDQPAIGHTAITYDTTWACRQRGGGVNMSDVLVVNCKL